ncbi:type II toxin-antitoxin system RelE/ParE family toxin [Vibrio vulnificus]|uniref:type II toxin-antitoxin system RelE/ParE family toxin n=1 Tax=Vibrio vulnificus TaxID=672 RepID=UPI000CD2D1EF|nr:type II toxin-antitoxin system RelE/ParE family toxin [Vibrio vulnificus]EHD0094774.1 type II toxin-antitoxin system RelE/ParE family toxin [Vibrio vulnificus]EJE8581673.1 type II toxin-antitoxin system RelE/ParE family toxin [Vibrio vulnificus]MCA4024207.1 type II toxin-antitoxin system RelE/ParE family toxin [Vibrio vulnificus]MCU8430786.1 type II toxin-antitoxin system RelE/ParE family toxin [Vibrio vulnificus]POC47532.1 hypothetical protein CRN48_07815 [Vibrio vulnificus]
MQEKEVNFKGDSEENLKEFPKKIKIQFLMDLVRLQSGLQPTLSVKPVKGLGKNVSGVLELRKNGKPAYRVVYKIKKDSIDVLHSFVKTSDKTDSKHIKTIKKRYDD